MPPLLRRLQERKPERLDWLGVSYGLTPGLLRFWKRAGYVPLYLRQTASDLTGEHTCVMVRGLNSSVPSELEWLGEFAKDFRRRFISLLSYKFREFGSVTALSILEAVNVGIAKVTGEGQVSPLTSQELSYLFTPFDLKRLESYANNALDYHVIQDLFPAVASLYFAKRFEATNDASTEEGKNGGGAKLTAVQSSILLALGLQRKSIEDVERELQIPVSQALALLVKIVRKLGKRLNDIQRAAVSATIPDFRQQQQQAPSSAPTASSAHANEVTGDLNIGAGNVVGGKEEWQSSVAATIEKELEQAGEAVQSDLRAKQKALLESLDLSKYAINDVAVDWDEAESQVKTLAGGGSGTSSIVSLKSRALKTAASASVGGDKGVSKSASGLKRKASIGGHDGAGEKKNRRSLKKVKR